MKVEVTRVSTCQGSQSKIKPTEFCLLVETKIYGDDVHIGSQWFTEVDDQEGFGQTIGNLIEWLAEKEEQAIIYMRPDGDLPARVTIYDAHI